jgi:paraquat-inducible protein A
MKKGFSKTWRAMLPWPKPPGDQRLKACHFCDTLHEFEPVDEGMSARCVRCGAMLYQNRPASLVRASAFSLTALFLMVLAHAFPFLTMNAASMRRDLTLVGAATALMDEGAPLLGASVFLFTMVTPLVLAGGMIYVCMPLMFGLAAPGARFTTRCIYLSEPWNMVEVFLLGVLVSLLKLAKVADVQFGIGFWAFAGLMLCLAGAVSGIDREELWDRLEVAGS